MRRSTLKLLPLAAVAFLLFVEPASGQESTTRGFTLGIHATGASLDVEGGDDGRSNAGGGGMRH
jgi:hypothetical protein